MYNDTPTVAYFCMEFGLHSDFRIYAGGLGTTAGDFLKGAKEDNLPVIGIGILWKQGYVEQYVDKNGNIVDTFYNNEYEFLKDTGIKVSVKIKTKNLLCRVWKIDCFGNSDLYLLDADIPENEETWVTGQLYGWFKEERIAQEIVLGIGGIKALRALGMNVDIYHFNEGHPVFAAFELIREELEKGCTEQEALSYIKGRIIVTNHTLNYEGYELHDLDFLEDMGALNGLNRNFIKEIGGEPFNMILAGLKICRKFNTVSEIHKKICSEAFNKINNNKINNNKIINITSGIHVGTWVDENIKRAFIDYKQQRNLWKSHMDNKMKLIDYIYSLKCIKFNEEKILIGYAQRPVEYKRGALLFKYEEKIKDYLENNMLQIVISSKSHPLDFSGKDFIKSIVALEKKYPKSIVFLDNYNMEKSALLTKGVDVWLNNSRVNKEACSTSGIKAAMNGVLNLSTLSGWWPEACWDDVTGWQYGDSFIDDNIDKVDNHDAESLYNVLFNKVLKTYYQDKNKWENMMYASIKGTIETHCSIKMVKEYYEKLYNICTTS